MTSMVFGAACSPTSAQFVKNINAKNFEQKYPEAAKVILENHYVDDYVASFSTVSDAVRVTRDVVEIHKQASFELRKFISNSKEILKGIGEENSPKNSVEKVLGLYWDLTEDVFKFKVPFSRFPKNVMEEVCPPTKRQVLQIVMSIFDPFGFLNDYTVLGRLILQDLWTYKLGWDEEIPESLNGRWKAWLRGLKMVDHIKISRCLSSNLDQAENIEVHVFTDASDKVFSAVAYLRLKYKKSVDISILISKVRVSPRKKVLSIPRMELQGAVLGIKIQLMILKNLTFLGKDNFTFWCDSKVVLCWIRNEDAHRFKPYVCHRIKMIQESSNINQWRYIPSNLNVADDSTKFKTKMIPSNGSRWIKGPEFLQLEETFWPKEEKPTNIVEKEMLEERTKFLSINVIGRCEFLIDFTKFSSYRKVVRIMAWVYKAKNLFLKRPSTSSRISYEEFQEAKIYLFKTVQLNAFKSEVEKLGTGAPLKKESTIRKLCPFLDASGVLRVRGRLENAFFMKYSSKYPIILPKYNDFTMMVIRQFHEDLFHQNKKLVLNEIKMQFWIPNLKRQLEKVTSKCIFCRIKNAKIVQPIMGPMPVERITPFLRPFSYTGLDYCGHYFVKNGRKEEKVWIILFTCMCSRAIHLEVVNNLKSYNCLLAISNFINRRGIPIQFRSDNAGYFLKSRKLLSDILSLEDIEANMTKYNIKWVTNTPESPHMGGAWERLIGCVKRVLDITINCQILNIEVFNSLVVEAENIVNSRPLTDVDLTDELDDVLTPNHFLLGSASTFQTRGEYVTPQNLPKQFRILKQLKQSLWVRWIKEYLPEFTKRSKWYDQTKSIALNDLVMICDVKQNYHKWTKGKVVKLYEGKDKQVRTVDVITEKGILKRPVNKLAILDLSQTDAGSENVGN